MSWEMIKLEDLTEKGLMVDGDWIESKDQDPLGGIRLLQLADIGDGNFIDKSKRFINHETAKNLKCTFLKKNDILIARMPDPLGRACLFPFEEDNKYITVVDVCIMRVKKGIDPNYVIYAINSPEFRKKLNSQITGTTRQRISGKNLKKLEIPLPPLETQKRIANILDAADALRQKDQELLKKYDELAQAIFIDMFGDPVKNEKHWEKVKMEKLMTIVRGGSPRPIDKFLGGKYPWIKIGDATKGDDVYLKSTREHIIEEGLSKTRLLPEGSLIFANCGVSLGFARIITFEGCIHDGWLAFSDFDDLKINKIFLLKALNSITEYFRNSAPEGTQPNLNTGIIKDFELILPPLTLQNKFEHILKSFKVIKENAEKNLKSSNQLFDSLLLKAFNGELVA